MDSHIKDLNSEKIQMKELIIFLNFDNKALNNVLPILGIQAFNDEQYRDLNNLVQQQNSKIVGYKCFV